MKFPPVYICFDLAGTVGVCMLKEVGILDFQFWLYYKSARDSVVLQSIEIMYIANRSVHKRQIVCNWIYTDEAKINGVIPIKLHSMNVTVINLYYSISRNVNRLITASVQPGKQ